MIKFYITAHDEGDRQILGNLDGQAVIHTEKGHWWRTGAVRRLRAGGLKKMYPRVAYWIVWREGYAKYNQDFPLVRITNTFPRKDTI